MHWRTIGLILTMAGTVGSTPAAPASAASRRSPNVVVLFIDDMGYADIGPFGADQVRTPHLDRMAAEGRRFTDFYVAQSICSASRAALLTGCYTPRVGIQGALFPNATHGLADGELTLAELCKQVGYATACFGKWHLGHHPQFLPRRHGFDEFFGLPYSHDMWPQHPWQGERFHFPPLPLIEGDRKLKTMTAADQARQTTWYTDRAVDFIKRHKDQPFFLYVPHPLVHVPLFVSDRFAGASGAGLYADVVMEIDASVGRILDALRRHGIDKNTLVMFTSDNGPWLSYGDHGGSAGPLREGKATSFEGGVRVPTIFWWPGTVPAGTTCSEPAMTIDILPTVARLIGAELPKHKIDGKDIGPLITGASAPEARSPHEAYFFYGPGEQLEAMRSGRWKLYFPHTYDTLAGEPGGRDGIPAPYHRHEIGLSLYDLQSDVGETSDVASQHPDVVERMQRLADAMRADLGDARLKMQGDGRRQPGRVAAGSRPPAP
jgi:arylsulfatase A-like enzyme